MNSSVEVLIIASKDDLQDGWDRAVLLRTLLIESGIKARLVNKLSSVLEDLHLVARYRVVSTPTTLILKDGGVVVRKLGLSTARSLIEGVDWYLTDPFEAD